MDINKLTKLLIVLILSVSCNNQAGKEQNTFSRKPDYSFAPNQVLEQLLGSSGFDFALYKSTENWEQLAEQIYDRPNGETIINAVKSKHPGKDHPRIILTKSQLEKVKKKIHADSLYAKWYDDVIKEANSILDKPIVTSPERHTLQNRLLPLGLVYLVSEDNKYAKRAWRELEAYCNLEHWNPTTQFLDIAYILKGFAIGFDWFYDYLNKEQKQTIITAVSEKAFKLSLVAYANPNTRVPYQNSKICGYDNWNGSINSGLIQASLAMCDEPGMEKLTGEVMENALRYWENYLKEFGPDGACLEGVGYWFWGVQSMVEGMAALESAAGTDYGIGKTPGFGSTVYFPFYMTGTEGGFNFGNAKQIFNITPEFYWFAQKYKNPKLGKIRKKFMDDHKPKAKVYDLLWYDKSMLENSESWKELPLDIWFKRTESVSLRSGWDDDDIYVAFKGGDNMATHGHLNTGTFVLDALGERWAIQLGGDSYSNPGYFNKGERNSQGYQYYRCRAEGQNTLLINPDTLSDQLPLAISKIIDFRSEPNRAYSIIDMTEAYAHEATSVKRGAMIFDKRNKVVLRDEIVCINSSKIYWGMHTKADIEIMKDGRQAILSQNGKRLQIDLICSMENAKFSVMKTVPLSTSPQSKKYNRKNEGVRKLIIALENVKDVEISVFFEPIVGTTLNSKMNKNIKLQNWN